MPAINSKKKNEKLAIVTQVLQSTELGYFTLFLERIATKYTEVYDARAQPLFYLINLLLGVLPMLPSRFS